MSQRDRRRSTAAPGTPREEDPAAPSTGPSPREDAGPAPASYRFLAAVRRALGAVHRSAAGPRILVGCSGGPDSTALLLALSALQGELELDLHVAYIDHGLRSGSAADGEHVAALAAALHIPAQVRRVTIPQPRSPGGLMAAARAARYQALAEIAAALQADAVAVGHTSSDQAETLLIRLLGGAGLRGLGGMRQSRPLFGGLPLIRPLLKLSRADVLAFVEASGLSPLSDPTNLDRRFLRGRVRHELLPLLQRDRPDIEAHLAALADQLQADADYLDRQAREALSRLQAELGRSEGGAPLRCALPAADAPVLLPARGLRALPLALASRVVLLASGGGLSQRHVAQVLDLCRSTDGSAWVDLPQGRRAERRYAVLRLDPLAGAQVPADQHSAATPRDAAVPGAHEVTTQLLVPASARSPALAPGDEATASFQAPPGDEPTTNFQVPDEPPSAAPFSDGPTAAIRIPDPAAGLLIHGPGRYHFNDTDLVVELATVPPAAPAGPPAAGGPTGLPSARSSAVFDADAIDFPLRLRVRRPGDRIRLRGLGHHKKVSDVLIDHKVPRPARAHVLVLCQGDEVLWIVGLRTAERGRPGNVVGGGASVSARPVIVCRLESPPIGP